MSEIIFLKIFLFIGFIVAPLMTNAFFLQNSKNYAQGHKISIIILLFAVLFQIHSLIIVWPLFCIYGFFSYLRRQGKVTFLSNDIVVYIPFIFSLISATWFFAGANDLFFLGYNQNWSFYAALHGNFLGWIFTGCLAFLANRENSNSIYLWGSYLTFIFFLFVAFGINGLLFLKSIGLLALTLIVPVLIGHYFLKLKKDNQLSRAFALISLCSIAVSMSLALLNEFWNEMPKFIWGISFMVLTHGLLNAVVTVPLFFLAIHNEKK